MTDYNLSVSDLLYVDGFIDAAHPPEDKAALEAILWTNGLDVYKPYSITEDKLHRNLHNKVVNCPRFEGSERLDKEWIKSGAASMFATIESCSDATLQADLRAMSKEVIQDRAWEN